MKNDHLWSFFNIIYTFLGFVFEPCYIQKPCYNEPCYTEVEVYPKCKYLMAAVKNTFMLSSQKMGLGFLCRWSPGQVCSSWELLYIINKYSNTLHNYLSINDPKEEQNHNYCRLLCHLLVILKVIFANSVDPDQTAPLGAVWSGSTLFACMQK